MWHHAIQGRPGSGIVRALNASQLRIGENYHFRGWLNTANDAVVTSNDHGPNDHGPCQGS